MKRVDDLKKQVYLCNSHEERLLSELEALNMRRRLNMISKKQYKNHVNALLKGRNVDDWIQYYKDYKGECFKVIQEDDSDKNLRGFLFVLLLLVLSVPFVMNFTGLSVYNKNSISVNQMVSSDAYLLIDGVAQPIPLQPELVNGNYVYNIKTLNIPENVKEVKIMDNDQIVFSKEI